MRIISIIILIFVGLSAIGGGAMLIADPTGVSMQFPIEWLKGTPFHNYFFPGLILLVFIGLFCLITAALAIKKVKNYPLFIIIQALIIIGWLSIELVFNIKFYHAAYHIPLYFLSIVLIFIGIKLPKNLD